MSRSERGFRDYLWEGAVRLLRERERGEDRFERLRGMGRIGGVAWEVGREEGRKDGTKRKHTSALCHFLASSDVMIVLPVPASTPLTSGCLAGMARKLVERTPALRDWDGVDMFLVVSVFVSLMECALLVRSK